MRRRKQWRSYRGFGRFSELNLVSRVLTYKGPPAIRDRGKVQQSAPELCIPNQIKSNANLYSAVYRKRIRGVPRWGWDYRPDTYLYLYLLVPSGTCVTG